MLPQRQVHFVERESRPQAARSNKASVVAVVIVKEILYTPCACAALENGPIALLTAEMLLHMHAVTGSITSCLRREGDKPLQIVEAVNHAHFHRCALHSWDRLAINHVGQAESPARQGSKCCCTAQLHLEVVEPQADVVRQHERRSSSMSHMWYAIGMFHRYAMSMFLLCVHMCMRMRMCMWYAR